MGGFQKNAGGRGPLKHEDALAFLQRAESATGASVYEHLTSVVQEVRSPPTLVPPPPDAPPVPLRRPSDVRALAASLPPLRCPWHAWGGSRKRGARARAGGEGGPGGVQRAAAAAASPPSPHKPGAQPAPPRGPATCRAPPAPPALGAIGNPPAARMVVPVPFPPPPRGLPPRPLGARAGRAGARAGGGGGGGGRAGSPGSRPLAARPRRPAARALSSEQAGGGLFGNHTPAGGGWELRAPARGVHARGNVG